MKHLILVVIFALTVTGFAYFALFSTPAFEDPVKRVDNLVDTTPSRDAKVDNETEDLSGLATLSELQKLGKNIECTITYQPNELESEIEGTYFVSEDGVRGDFLIDSPDFSSQILSSMIIVDDTMYLWTEIEGEAYGTKTDLSKESDASLKTNEPVPLDDKVRYNCKTWENVDRTVFVPPSSVLFQDLDSLPKIDMEYGTIYESP